MTGKTIDTPTAVANTPKTWAMTERPPLEMLKTIFKHQGFELRKNGDLYHGDDKVAKVNMKTIRFQNGNLHYEVTRVVPPEHCVIGIEIKPSKEATNEG